MEWKVDDPSIDWIIEHKNLYCADQPNAIRIMDELQEATQNRLNNYTAYISAKNKFLEKLCNNYVVFRSGLYRLTDKPIVITQVEGYLMYEKQSKRWIPIGYLKEKRLPYTNRSFIESTEKGSVDFIKAIAEARESWIDQEIGSNMRILRNMRGIWMRMLAVLLLLGCDLAMLWYLVDILGTGIWIKLFLCDQATIDDLFRYSLQPENLTVSTTIGMLVCGVLVLLLMGGLMRDAWLIVRVRVVTKTIKRYEYLEKCLRKIFLQIRSKDMEAMERELATLRANKAIYRSMMPAGSMQIRQKSIWMCHFPCIIVHVAVVLTLLALSVLNLYML